ncbi:YqaA family protein [Acidomonas methanolica]|uniref:Alkaline phosphatase DedA n=1 Tax=Acidomonas methanolica NBRC 104435 TaxID=1231351 RepID=A0A023D368_ACIMT|nr:VTT domain-containing protein [Acidomonas methanolica]MBU2655182.1 DedA family protein [Acidomonas methanolica]TCS24709.1 membrane protein YqaA with SNARE-associated domain [Acidomonas methanolica]GAJ28236.1 alkaline phosphatase DedA [Acidomonas methanolica NBRC 104435]
MFLSLYRRMMALAAARHARLWLFAVAFAEASFFPLPVDLMLAPMVLARRDRAWELAALCTAGSVAGALAGWLLGAFLLAHVALPIVRFYHGEATLTLLQHRFDEYGVAIILLKGLTPIPFKLVTLAAGAAHFALLPFLAACVVTRGARFFLLAGLLRHFGAPIQTFIEERLTLVLLGVFTLIILGVLAVRYI